ncbi:MAG: class I SAM-dependent methyltransferase [Opitutaceae bacterium]|jgi:SAM-dependent methyltransferase|nr:class I SAM-dependent methyltransferase [Opitutaceae bacterium]
MNSHPPIDRTVSSRDEMVFPGNEENYFEVGHEALGLIQLAQRVCNREWLPRILDLPCGHGRVLRWLRAAFEYADITACDLNRDGVDFCQQQFKASGVYSDVDLQKIDFNPEFDLIWCGSLFTHLPLAAQLTTLNRLLDWTVEDGIIVLTLQGRFMATQLERGDAEFADNVDVVGLLRDFRTNGAAYRPYYEEPSGEYGLTLNSPAQVNTLIQSKPGVIMRAYLEQAWSVQDVLILYKKSGYYSSVLT